MSSSDRPEDQELQGNIIERLVMLGSRCHEGDFLLSSPQQPQQQQCARVFKQHQGSAFHGLCNKALLCNEQNAAIVIEQQAYQGMCNILQVSICLWTIQKNVCCLPAVSSSFCFWFRLCTTRSAQFQWPCMQIQKNAMSRLHVHGTA